MTATFGELQRRYQLLQGSLRTLDGVMQYLRLLLPTEICPCPPDLPFTRQDLVQCQVPPDAVLNVIERLGGTINQVQAELAELDQLAVGSPHTPRAPRKAKSG